MTFYDLHQLLLEELRQQVRSGAATERGLARVSGVSQPHLHNVLKGKRQLSLRSADGVLHRLQIDLLQLIERGNCGSRAVTAKLVWWLASQTHLSSGRPPEAAGREYRRSCRERRGLSAPRPGDCRASPGGGGGPLRHLRRFRRFGQPPAGADGGGTGSAGYAADSFQEDQLNLVQINVRGRILQVSFSATGELVSTEDFRVPYTLEGAVRAFNQELLDKDIIEEQLIFYTLENHKKMWRFFDARTYRSGPFDQEYLIGLMEQLL